MPISDCGMTERQRLSCRNRSRTGEMTVERVHDPSNAWVYTGCISVEPVLYRLKLP